MRAEDRDQRRTKVSGDREVALLVELLRAQPRPLAVNPPAIDFTAGDPDDVAVAVIGAAVAVLAHGSPELRQDDDHRVAPCAPEPVGQSHQAFAERTEVVGKPSLTPALIDMGVP